ncbi:hypothetical protein K9O30_01830 [Clostridium bowmanii]|uniref:hypothetical protein n=1 Tax=Clostridium bowmanii TaxID=132925 RepID=UPI001C0DC407|nr:hypothetical protein [Clostridium bowmanii]MBU3190290.1 hypothetical protein [Clostridium bowmanii]MCA1072498.1 hypothetical protein [Clostridium bowmanii]
MVNKKLIMAFSKFAMVAILASSVSGVAYAQDGDLWKDDVNLGGIGNVLLHNKSSIFNMIRYMDTYGYEVENKIYDASKVNEQFNSNPNATIEAIKSKITTNLTAICDVPVASGVVVQSVSATNGENGLVVTVVFNKELGTGTFSPKVLVDGIVFNMLFDDNGHTDIDYNQSTYTAKLPYPKIQTKNVAQNVDISITLGDQVKTISIVIPAAQ